MLILIQSLIIGALIGMSIGIGASNMFHIPDALGMGSFRMLSELNACKGERKEHATFGAKFLFQTGIALLAFGTFTQDLVQRSLPNLAASLLMKKGSTVEETLHHPVKMGIAGGIAGMFFVGFFMLITRLIPETAFSVAREIFSIAAFYFVSVVMPVFFWLAAIDAGRKTGFYGTLLGATSHLLIGNAVLGIVLGIVLGKSVEDLGWKKTTLTLLVVMIAIFVGLAHLSQFDWGILAEGLRG
ncbi:MAG: DUF4311 domain-containing protein [Defluviitaleaceae bacterium]|nr:DUF4311 domain-containing protein [Defluviitaleaceae bacterium]